MTILDRRSQDVRRYYPEALERLRAFQTEIFGEGARQLDAARFRWLFEANPEADPAGPDLWIAEHEGEVVGEQAGLPHRLKVGRAQYHSSWTIDLMVRPAWRLRGIGPALTETHRRARDLLVAVGATDVAFRAIVRAGWHDLGFIPTFVRPFRLRPLLNWRGKNRGLVGALAGAASPLLRVFDAVGGSLIGAGGRRLVEVPAFDERADEIWRLSQADRDVLAVRDSRFLRWRFDSGPDRETYRRLLLLEGRRPLGYAVLRRGTQAGVDVGFITDYLAPRCHTLQLLAGCVATLRRTGVAAVVLDVQDASVTQDLPRLGFVQVRRASGKRFLFREGASAGLPLALLSDPSRWFVTRADSDWDHPD